MKKFISILLSVMLMLSISVPAFANTDADAVNEVYASITRQSLGANPFDAVVYDNLTLPTTDPEYNSVIIWSSSNDAVISSSGEVTRGNDTKSVTLTANITVGESRRNKVFSFRVPGIYDENYNGFSMINEEFTGSTLSAKVENQSGSALSQSGGYLNIANTGASRTNIYLKENKSGISNNVALEFSVERTNKENEFTIFFKNQAGTTLNRLTLYGESTNYGSVYLRHYVDDSEKLVSSFNSSELGSVTKYNVRVETDPQNNLCRFWINGVHVGDTNMRSSSDIASIQILKTAIAGDIEEGSVHALKIDNIAVSYLDDSYRSAKLIYANEFDDDVIDSGISNAKEENGYFIPTNNKEKIIAIAGEADGGVVSDTEVIVEYDLRRIVGDGLSGAGNNAVVKVTDNAGVQVFRLQWMDVDNGMRFYHGTADAKTGTNAYYLIKVAELANYGIDNDSEDNDNLYVKAVINNSTKTFRLFINGVQVTIGNHTEFDFYAEATGVGAVALQRNSASNIHKLAAIRCYIPGTQTKPLAETTTLDYNAFDKKLNIRSSLDQTGKIFVASYLRDELISLSPVSDSDITLKANEDTQVSVKANIDGSADEIKIFLWSSETDCIIPLSKNISTSRISSN